MKKVVKKEKNNDELSYDVKLVIVLVTLFVIYPVGLILMFKWMNWPKWLMWLIALPVLIFLLILFSGIFFGLLIAFINPQKQIEKAKERQMNDAALQLECTKTCSSYATDNTVEYCIQKCITELKEDR